MKRCMYCMMQYDDNLTVCPECGYDEHTLPEVSYYLKPGTVLNDRYLLGEAIGCGGFGITYIGWDNLLDRKVAIKEYYPSGVVNRDINSSNISITGATKADFYREGVEKFLAEAKVITKFSDFSNIVQIYDYLEENNTAYIIMEYINGVTLEEYLDSHEGSILHWSEAVSITIDILGALEIVHDNEIIHRDISPANIMISNDGTVKLLDFGAARKFVADRTQEMSVIIKKGYAPIEQYKRDYRQDERSDLYSVGAVMYRMLTGEAPTDALNRISEDKLKRARSINKDIPAWLEVIVMRAMDTNPYVRYANAKAFLKELRDGENKEKIRKRISAIVLSAFCVLAILVGVSFMNHINDSAEREAANYYINMPGTIDMHENESSEWHILVDKIDIEIEGLKEYDYELNAEVADESIATVYVDDSLNLITIKAKQPGKTTLKIVTRYASKDININIKKEETVYPEPKISKAILEVGKDIPAGEYVAFARNDYAHFDIKKQEREPNSSLDNNNVYFEYNCYLGLSEGESIEIENAYLVPEDEAIVDTSADGMFKVGKDIEEGMYRVVFNKDNTYSYTMHSAYTMYPSFFEHGKTVQKIYLDEEGYKYIHIKDGHLEKCNNQEIDESEIINRQWYLRKSIVHGKTFCDYYTNEEVQDVDEIEKIAKGNKELENVLLVMPLYDVKITEYKDGSAKFDIPSGYVQKTDKSLKAASLGEGRARKNKDGSYTYKITNPDSIEHPNPQTVNKKGTEFRYEILSDTELHFYYDYYDMVLVFNR